MREQNKTGLAVTLIASSSIACGVLLCLAVWEIGRISVYEHDPSLYFGAYLTGSIGFLLIAPVNLLMPILRKHGDDTSGIVTAWCITTLAVLLLACAIGTLFMLISKWMNGVTPSSMTIQFLSGAFLLFVSGGIHWLFSRKKRN